MWKKILVPALVVALLWIAGNTATTYYLQRVHEVHSSALVENVSTIRAAWAMQDALWRLQAVVMELQEKARRETLLEVAELEAAFDRRLVEAEESSYTEHEQSLSRAVRQHFAVYRDHVQTCLEASGPNGEFVTDAAQDEKTMRLARAVAEPCRELVDLNERMLAEATLRSERLLSFAEALRLSFLAAGPVVGVLFAVALARGLRHSIARISVTLKSAAGDVDYEVGPVDVRTARDLAGLQEQAQVVADRVRQVWKQLQETRGQAMSAARLAAVGELAAGVAHELRNPLTSVNLLIQTATPRGSDFALDHESFQVVRQEIARMESTIQALLDFARPAELHRLPHDLRKTVRRALNLVAGRAKQQNIAIAEDFPDRPAIVDGDPEQLHQIVVNLLLNALQAMPEGGDLHLAIRADTGRENACSLVVCDSGPGIEQGVLSRIFEPFVTSKERGTGLGLAVSHRIAAEHGGVLQAVNRAEGGAVFTLKLPTDRGTTLTGGRGRGDVPSEEPTTNAPCMGDCLETTDAKSAGD